MARALAGRQRGVTLIELMVAVTLSGIVLLAVSGIFVGIQKQWAYSVTRGKAVEAAQMVLDQIATDVHGAISVQAVDGARADTFVLPANTDGQGTYVPARIGAMVQYAPGLRAHYYLSDTSGIATGGAMLWRETNSQLAGDSGWTPDSGWSLTAGIGSKPKYNYVTALTFTAAGQPANTVLVTVSVQVSENQQSYSLTLQRSVFLANHN